MLQVRVCLDKSCLIICAILDLWQNDPLYSEFMCSSAAVHILNEIRYHRSPQVQETTTARDHLAYFLLLKSK